VSRGETAAVQAALNASNVPLLVFIELDFSTGFVRVTNASYNFDWNGYTWLGLGRVLRIAQVEESGAFRANALQFELSGVPSDMISVALGTHYQGRAARLWLAPLDDNFKILADPVLCWSGRMDTMSVSAGQQAVIAVTAESRLADLERPRVRRYNDADQRAAYPGDLGMQFVEQMVEKELVWGRS
jgi:hypothetical protein